MKPTRPVPGLAGRFAIFALPAVVSLICPGARRAIAEDESDAARLSPSATSDALLAAGDRSARKGRMEEALENWKRAYERRFPSFRHVPFAFPVRAEYLDRKGLRAMLVKEFGKEMPKEKADAEKASLAAFGLLPEDLDLRETLLGLLTEEIAGFYDPETKELYLIRESPKAEPPAWWEKLLPRGGGGDEEKIALIHEMSHALMDQHHDLLSMDKSVEEDDDAGEAVKALVEGEATLSMLIGGPGGGTAIFDAPPGFFSSYGSIMELFAKFAGGSRFRRAPRVLQEDLLFPYMKGLEFCIALASSEKGWGPIDRAFSDPPLSTEQVLHPEKYGRDVPLAVTFPDVAEELGAGWSLIRTNVVGEFLLRLVLEQKLPARESDRAAAGWGGDLYRIYQGPAGDGGKRPAALVFTTVWDTKDDAEEFREAIEKVSEGRFPGEEREAPASLGGLQAKVRKGADGLHAVLRRDDTVWLFQSIPEASWEKVVRRSLEVGRREKVYHPVKAKPAVEFREEDRLRRRRV